MEMLGGPFKNGDGSLLSLSRILKLAFERQHELYATSPVCVHVLVVMVIYWCGCAAEFFQNSFA
jgi:hypothetical protein